MLINRIKIFTNQIFLFLLPNKINDSFKSENKKQEILYTLTILFPFNFQFKYKNYTTN
jgi:hypothetical protein